MSLAASLRRARPHNEGKISSAHPQLVEGLNGAERLVAAGRWRIGRVFARCKKNGRLIAKRVI